jgi:hypothetical protein
MPYFTFSVVEDDLHLINNTGVWPSGCLIAPYYGRLNPDQIYSTMSASSRPSSPGTGVSTLDLIGGSANSDGPQEDGSAALSSWLIFVTLFLQHSASKFFRHLLSERERPQD